MANFNYCPTIVQLLSKLYTQKNRRFTKRAPRFLNNIYEISLKEFLSKSTTSSMNTERLTVFCAELYETINKLNPNFMKDLFKS